METGNGNRENSSTKIIQVKSRLDVIRLGAIQIIRDTLGGSNKVLRSFLSFKTHILMLLGRLAFKRHFLYNSHNNLKPRNKISRISQREMGSEKGQKLSNII